MMPQGGWMCSVATCADATETYLLLPMYPEEKKKEGKGHDIRTTEIMDKIVKDPTK